MANRSLPHLPAARIAAESIGVFLAFLFGFTVICVLLISATKAVADTTTPPADNLVRPGDMGLGALLLKSTQDGLYVEAPRMATDVEIDVTGPIIRARVTQRFENPSDAWVEGIYVFPLPEDAGVDALKMLIGDRVIEGQVKEKQEARRIYEAAKAGGYKASLVEQERANIFTNSVANIGPGETVVVQIEYQDAARYDNGVFSLRFPMVVAHRYNPAPEIVQTVDFGPGEEGAGWGFSDPVPDRDRITPPVARPSEDPEAPLFAPLTLAVTLAPGFAVERIDSAHHDMIERKIGRDRYALALKDGAVEANRDFALSWTPKPSAKPTAALFKEEVDGDTYLLAMVVPQADALQDDNAARPREAIFVIDNSGSMSGPSIEQAKMSLLLALDRLGPDDLFNVIRFDNTTDMAFAKPVAVTDENVRQAKRWVSRLTADGGTEMLPALRAALVDAAPADDERVRQVIFLTDGAIGNEAQLFSEIGANLGRTRLFTVGIGSAPNSYFMSRAARLGKGTFTHIGELTEVRTKMGELFEKLERPVMTDLVAGFDGAALTDVWPRPIPDLYAGEPVMITARLEKPRGALRLSGRIGAEGWGAEMPLRKAARGEGVAKLWARRKIASVEESRYDGVAWDEVDRTVLATALEFGLVSRLTSLVAVDVTPARPDGTPLESRDVPVNLPDGWDFEKVFGEAAPAQMRRQRDAAAPDASFTALAMKAAPLAPPAQAAGLPLPQGALGWTEGLIAGLALWLAAVLLLSVRFVGRRDDE
ncbi:MAG: marine proteobacterial sortase target protein [Pseudomonadota bacterium]